MKSPDEYWIWLARTIGTGKQLESALSFFRDPITLYEVGYKEWLASGVISRKACDSLGSDSPSEAYSVLSECAKQGWSVVTPDSEFYPKGFTNIRNAPCVLFVQGDVSVLKMQACIGMVGTRDASEYGASVARSLAYELALCGALIVSGGALGVDSASHTGAMDAGGKTVAFLGSGLGSKYLSSNKPLRERISQNGALVSEFMPYTEPSRHTFPIRNRLISGMSLGVVVIEAGEKSGSLITARKAAEQGRDVFVVPGDVRSVKQLGANALLRDGAKPVFSSLDVLESYPEYFSEAIKNSKEYTLLGEIGGKGESSSALPEQKPQRGGKSKGSEKKTGTGSKAKRAAAQDKAQPKQPGARPAAPQLAGEAAKRIFEKIGDEGSLADELAVAANMPVHLVLAALTELEMLGAVRQGAGQRYFLC